MYAAPQRVLHNALLGSTLALNGIYILYYVNEIVGLSHLGRCCLEVLISLAKVLLTSNDLCDSKKSLTTLSIINEAENPESQPENKRDRLTTLSVINEAENGEPQLQNKRGKYLKFWRKKH